MTIATHTRTYDALLRQTRPPISDDETAAEAVEYRRQLRVLGRLADVVRSTCSDDDEAPPWP